MHITDWLPTLMHVVTNESDDFRLGINLDGIDQWNALSNDQKESQRTEILYNIDPKANASALRVGDMKLVFASRGSTRHFDSWYPTPDGRRDQDGTVLEGPRVTVPYDSSGLGDTNIQTLRPSAKRNYTTSDRLHFITEYNNDGVFRPPFLSEAASPRQSELRHLLEKIGRKPLYPEKPLKIECGPRPGNASSNCRPWLRACLFNVTADPCEYENLASGRPDVVKMMKKRLRFYRQHAVRPLNKPVDDAGLPYHHNWNWVPWRKA